ncbi:MAG: hypothetical protein QOD66_387, partial [Solirubrobacteraceae bacterium]|nr:hypothetical protein [Solirubrobacteraceae bacterium]
SSSARRVGRCASEPMGIRTGPAIDASISETHHHLPAVSGGGLGVPSKATNGSPAGASALDVGHVRVQNQCQLTGAAGTRHRVRRLNQSRRFGVHKEHGTGEAVGEVAGDGGRGSHRPGPRRRRPRSQPVPRAPLEQRDMRRFVAGNLRLGPPPGPAVTIRAQPPAAWRRGCAVGGIRAGRLTLAAGPTVARNTTPKYRRLRPA